MVEHLESFHLDLKFSAGIWFFSPAEGRFHERYGEPLSIEQRLEIARGLKEHGLAGLEAHYPNEINEENEKLWRASCASTWALDNRRGGAKICCWHSGHGRLADPKSAGGTEPHSIMRTVGA